MKKRVSFIYFILFQILLQILKMLKGMEVEDVMKMRRINLDLNFDFF